MRLFVAVWPSRDVVALLEAMNRPEVDGVRWTSADQWHVTVRFFGTISDDADVGGIAAALEALAAPMSKPVATLGPETACFGRSILHLPCGGLEELAGRVVDGTASFGDPPEDRPFRGHITLARSRASNRGRRRGDRVVDLRRFAGTAISGSFPVDELTLVRSITAREGARYEVLQSFALATV